MGVIGTLTMSGSLPLNELNLRVAGSPSLLHRELTNLRDAGLVAFDGELPDANAIPQTTTQVRLTLAGLRKSLA